MPSAKYSCSGSFDKLAKGRTTSDRRGAGSASGAGGRCALAAAGVWTGTAVGFPLGQAHQTAIPMAIIAARLAVMTVSRAVLLWCSEPACAGTATSGNDATAAALIA